MVRRSEKSFQIKGFALEVSNYRFCKPLILKAKIYVDAVPSKPYKSGRFGAAGSGGLPIPDSRNECDDVDL